MFKKLKKIFLYTIKNIISSSELLSKIFVSYTNDYKNLKYDFETIQVMKKFLAKNSNCVDVGCHKGDILKKMLKYAPKGQHYAFEPIPNLYQYLSKKYKHRAYIYPIALSDKKNETTFNLVTTNPSYSGFKKRSYDFPDEKEQTITVKTDLLDDIIPSNQKIDLIKIDVEGAEYQVLKGALNTLKNNKPLVVFEHGLGAADHYKTTPQEIFDLLTNCGLQISLMENFLTSKPSLDRNEFINQFEKRYNYYFIAHP